MEALVLLVGAFLFLPLLFGAVAVLNALGLLLLALVELVLTLLRVPVSLLRSVAAGAASPWPRRVGRILLGIVGVLAVGLLLVDTVLFAPALRWGLGRVKGKTGTEIRFEAASGSFLRGTIRLQGVSLRRTGDPGPLDLRAREAELELELTAFFQAPAEIRRLRIGGLEGSIERTVDAKPSSRPFRIGLLAIEDARVEFRDRRPGARPADVPVTVERLEARPFRSDWAVLDTLFRSAARGTLGGAPFEIATTGDGAGRKTTWKATGIDARFLAAWAGGPFAWLQKGRVDVEVLDTWRIAETTEIDMHWKVLFRDLAAGVPEGTKGVLRAVAQPVVDYANDHAREFPLEFMLTMDEIQLKGASSLEAAGLWDAASEALTDELARRAGVPIDTVRKLGRKTLDLFKSTLEKRRTQAPK